MNEQVPIPGLGAGEASALRPASVAPAVALPWDGPQQEEKHLRDYWNVLRRRWWIVATTLLIVATAATVWTFTRTPVYRGTASVKIDRDQPRILTFQQEVLPPPGADDYYQTQYKILQSRAVAGRAIAALHLEVHPEFSGKPAEEGKGWWASLLGSLPWRGAGGRPVAPAGAPGGDREDLLVGAFLSRLEIEPVRNTRLVHISFRSHDPVLSARVPNTLAEAYIRYNLESKVEATKYASEFLQQQLEEMRVKLEAAEQRLEAFARQNAIFLVGVGKLEAGEPDVGVKRLAALQDALFQAQNERVTKELAHRQVQKVDLDALPPALTNPLVTGLREQYYKLEAERSTLSQVYKPEYPKMVQLGRQIAEIRSRLQVELQRQVEGIAADYRVALAKEERYNRLVQEQRADVMRVSEASTQYNVLQREVQANRELYNSLLQRLKETGLSAGLTASNLQILDRAEVPQSPAEPNRRRNILIGILVGLAGGLGLAFLVEHLDDTVRSTETLERFARIPALGIVPVMGADRRRALGGDGVPEPHRVEVITHQALKSPVSEAFRNIRTALLFSTPERPPRSILFTSPVPEEGKTTVAINCAIALAQLERRVVVVDADLRRPQIHRIFGGPAEPGLSNVLTGSAELKNAVRSSGIPRLYLLPAGRSPVNPAELLASASMVKLLKELAGKFDHVLIDSSPALGFADAMILATLVDGTVLVVDGQATSRNLVQQLVRQLQDVRGKILGAVLNKIDPATAGPYYYYRYYHRYYGSPGADGRDGRDGKGPSRPQGQEGSPSPLDDQLPILGVLPDEDPPHRT